MKAEQIYEILATAGIQPEAIRLRDNAYVLFDRTWLEKIFEPAFRKFLENLDAQTYVAESNDCDDFADCAAWYARRLHAQFNKSGTAAAAFGTFSYVIEKDGGGHCINFAIIAGSAGAELEFLEPQTGLRVDLTPGEIASCSEARI